MIARRETGILRIEKARAMLAEAIEVDEVKQIRDQALAMKAYARTQKAGNVIAFDAAAIVALAERRLGEMARTLPKTQPKPGAKVALGSKEQVIVELGLTMRDAQRFQELAEIPEEKLEKYIAHCKETGTLPSTRGALSVSGDPDYDGDEWFTPAEWVDRARAALGGSIDLDPASNAHAQKTVRAAKFYTKDDDGLSKPWTGRVFCNPPYSTALIKAFSDKLIASLEELRDCTAAVYLVNNCTDAGWFQDCLHWCDAVCFPRGRIAFENANGVGFATRQGQAFFWFGEDAGPFRAAFNDCGAIMVPE